MERQRGTYEPRTVVRTRHGYGVRGGGPGNLTEKRTRREAQQWADEATGALARVAAAEVAEDERDAKWLAERGLTEIDYRQLRPGDLYAAGLYRPVRTVTGADHLDSGASLVFHDASRVERLTGDFGHLLLVPGFPVYGVLRHGVPAA
jgi:hypothetical protein